LSRGEEEKMSRARKNVLAAVLLAVAVLTASVVRAEGPVRGLREANAGQAWVIRILDWLGLPAHGLGTVRETSSAHIDPNGEPSSAGGGTGASSRIDDSAHIDPNG
jgi:hypothetical protein